MKITPQDIIDKEFKVKFRGFDPAEVDVFLEEVAESLFQITEENTLLHEKILVLQRNLEASGSMVEPAPVELPAELVNLLEDLKQDTAAIGAELNSLKQGRPDFDALEKNLKEAISSIADAAEKTASHESSNISPDLFKTLEELSRSANSVAAELAALKEERLHFASLQKSFDEAISTARDSASSITPQGESDTAGDLSQVLDDVRLATEIVSEELTALKKEIGSIAKMGDDIRSELQEFFTARFAELDAKLSATGTVMLSEAPLPEVSPAALKTKEALPTAQVEKEPDTAEKASTLPDYSTEEEDADDGDLEFLSEDDILDVDKLRGIFQSVLDEGVGDGHESREGDDAIADLLFIEDDLIEDDHEPEVTFSLDDSEPAKKQKR